MNKVRRLHEFFKPSKYSLSIDLSNAKNRSFSGQVDIIGELKPGQTSIDLHSKDLTIRSALIDGKLAQVSHGDFDELHLTHKDLQPGKHIVTLSFEGKITDPMHGLYPCYFEHDGIKKELYATQFESHYAREVFPCVDEPAAKATFDLTLTTSTNITVLSNQPQAWQRQENGKLVTAFQTTPKMSTYLLAWIVGELHKKTANTKDGTEVAVWATPAQKPESLDFALDASTQIIEFYEEYFDTPYPLAKSDHVALPDFRAGAMENWGLVTYREIALLADPETTDIRGKQYIASVVAHELAHMWFGNLVTMKWWNNLWLNESFATMVSYLAIDAIYPEWNTWLEFSSSEAVMALRRDAIDGVQPVQTDVNHPDEISALFDGAIVYAKGARLLRMLQRYVGDTDFRNGLRQYFKDHAYNNTEADDLWQAIASSSGKDIVPMMNSWISQSGYPVVSVRQNSDEIELSQKQFFIGPHQYSNKLWQIPLNSSFRDAPKLLNEKSLTFKVENTTEPIRFNVDDSAHFITHYDKDLFKKIIEQINNQQISAIDNLQILHESTLLARGGVTPTAQLIELLKSYKQEPNEAVWDIISLTLAELRKFVEGNKKAEQALKNFSKDIAWNQFQRLGWEVKDSESNDDTKLRSTIIGLVLYGEDSQAVEYANEQHKTNSLDKINPELRPLIISSAVKHGNDEVVDELLKIYSNTQNVDLSNDIAVGITSTRSPQKIALLLEAIKNPQIVRLQDVFRWYAYLIRGRESRQQTWQWIRDNWQWAVDTFGGDGSHDDFPRYAAASLVTQQQLNEYKKFFEPMKKEAALNRTISLGITEIEGRLELIQRDRHGVIKALAEYTDPK